MKALPLTLLATLLITQFPPAFAFDTEREELRAENASELTPTDHALESTNALKSLTSAIHFSRACETGTHYTVVATGDILLHGPLQKQGLQAGFSSLWRNVIHLLKNGDITYGNLEGPVSGAVSMDGKPTRDPKMNFDGVAYTGYPQFNYHPSILPEIVSSGFDVVSTANNHAMDRHLLGADRTIDNLKLNQLLFTGTRKSDEANAPLYTVTEKNGLRMAWIACTFSTNGIRDTRHQVTLCYEDKTAILDQVRRLSKTPGIDAVVVTPHWGTEYNDLPDSQDRALGRQFLEAGATLVLGNHPHVLQPMEKIVTSDHRETFLIYSMGNFISGQPSLKTRVSAIVYVGLTRGFDGKVFVNGVRYVPTLMDRGMEGYSLKPIEPNHEGYAHAVQILGSENVMTSHERLNTTPECR